MIQNLPMIHDVYANINDYFLERYPSILAQNILHSVLSNEPNLNPLILIFYDHRLPFLLAIYIYPMMITTKRWIFIKKTGMSNVNDSPFLGDLLDRLTDSFKMPLVVRRSFTIS